MVKFANYKDSTQSSSDDSAESGSQKPTPKSIRKEPKSKIVKKNVNLREVFRFWKSVEISSKLSIYGESIFWQFPKQFAGKADN